MLSNFDDVVHPFNLSPTIQAMSFPIEKLFAEVDMDASDAKTLAEMCQYAGLTEAVDPAFLSYDEAVEVTGGDSRLAGLLMEAGRKTRPLV